MPDLSTGLSALLAARYAIDVAGHNIANANTPGYTRQRINLSPAPGNLTPVGIIGTGVNVDGVMAIRDQLIEKRLLWQTAGLGAVAASGAAASQFEGIFNGVSEGNLNETINSFFSAANDLATSPEDPQLKSLLIAAGQRLADQIRGLSEQINTLRSDLTSQIGAKTEEANSLLNQITELNRYIHRLTDGNNVPNDLIDRRDEAIRRLSALIDIQTVPGQNGQMTVLHSGEMLVNGPTTIHLQVAGDTETGKVTLEIAENGSSLDAAQGTLGGLLDAHNEWMPKYVGKFDELASSLIRAVNAIHATGVSMHGPATSWTADNSVYDANQDRNASNDYLVQAKLPFAIVEGTVTFSVTDLATGQAQQTSVQIDPGTETLSTLIAKINAVGYLHASEATGTLTISAESGYRFTTPEDSAGLLTALGLNSFFTGGGRSDIAVRAALVDDPSLLCGGSTSAPGDNSNLIRLTELQQQGVVGIEGLTIEDAFQGIVSGIGIDVAQNSSLQQSQSLLLQTLQNQRDSVSGVSVDEEMTSLVQSQQAYEAAARYLRTVMDLIKVILEI